MRLTNPDRVLFPGDGVTKAELAAWYDSLAASLLPQLIDRPLSVLRVAGDRRPFFQRHFDAPRGGGRRAEFVTCNSREQLQELAQLGVVELHTWGTRRQWTAVADCLTFDLDPGTGVGWAQLQDAALAVRRLLGSLDLESFVKATGGKGLHVVVPLTPPRPRWARAFEFTRSIAQHFATGTPAQFTARRGEPARRGRVFVDYLRNTRGASSVAAFSPRWRPGVPVAVPLSWEELEALGELPRYALRTLDARAARERARTWRAYDDVRQSLRTSSTGRLSGLTPRHR